MAITYFVEGDWFPHSRKVVLQSRPSSHPHLLEAVSLGLQERVTKLYFWEARISFFVEADESTLGDIGDACRLLAHRSVAGQAASARRSDTTASGELFCAGAEAGRGHGCDDVVDGASQGWSHFIRGQSRVVTINVGGQLFTTAIETLCRFPESFLSGMFEGRFPVSRDSSGRVFIDRDPKVFKTILNYMRDSTVPTPRDECKSQALLAEARYFQLADLEAQCLNAWKQILVVTCHSHNGEALVNSVHLDGPPQDIKRLRTMLNDVLSPEHFSYMLDGTVLAVDVDGGHGGVEIAAHGLGGWNHGNSLFQALAALGWELRDQSICGVPAAPTGGDAQKDAGGGGINSWTDSILSLKPDATGNRLGGAGRGRGRGGGGGRNGLVGEGGRKLLPGVIIARYIFRR